MAGGETVEDVGGRHPSQEVLARILSGTAEADEVRQEVLGHLVGCCGECRRRVEGLEELGRQFGHWDISEAMSEWREAPRLWRQIVARPYEQQLAAIEADEDYVTWGMCRFLQLMSAGEVSSRAAKAGELANLAVRIAGKLGETYDVTWVRGLRALCLACLGNARRTLGEIQGATDALAAARELIEAGVGNEVFEAEVLVMAGLLARDRRRLGEAVGLFEAAEEVASRPGSQTRDTHLVGAVLAQEAWCLHHQGDPAAAEVRLEQASHLVDAGRDPGLAWEIGLGRAWTALSLGKIEQARRLVAAAREAAGELQRACLVHHLTGIREADRPVSADAPGAPPVGEQAAAGAPIPAEGAVRRLSAEWLRELATETERRRRPGLTWWSALRALGEEA